MSLPFKGESSPSDNDSVPEKIIKHHIELPNDTQNYNMKNPKRGHAIIITNETFHSNLNLKSRPPAVIDEKTAKECLKNLGFTIHSYTDYTIRQLLNLTGHLNGIMKNVTVYLSLYQLMVVMMASRGLKFDQGTFMETTTDAKSFTHISNSYLPIPLLSDCLILYSSFEGYVSFEDSRNGSWLISSFFKILEKNAFKNDILSIIRETSRKIAFDLEANTTNIKYNLTKQMPTLHSYLTRKLQFQIKPGELERIIIPQHYQKLSDQISPLYKMDHKNRGKAIIFNFEHFDENMLFFIHKKKQPNQGLNINVEENIVNLKKTLENYGFNVEIFQDLNTDRIQETSKKLSKYNYTDCDCLMIIINTHEYGKKIILSDNLIDPYDIFNYFLGNNCTTLIGKPKLFFMNIENHPSGLSNDFKSLVRDENITNNTNNSNENEPMISLNEELTKIPESADILIMYSSTFGITYEENHSYFLKELHGQLSSNLVTKDKPKEILDILTEVNRCVTLINNILNNDKSETKKIITRIVSTLTKELYLK